MEVGADTWERRQKASAVLIGFLSWTRLLSGIRVERENGSEPELGQMTRRDQDGKSLYLQSPEWVPRIERCAVTSFCLPVRWLNLREIELKSQSRSPVSQAVARSGTTEWHPYRS